VAEPITFAVVGHDEAATLANVLEQVHEAARPGDEIWFVDSASSDGSAAIARQMDVEVLRAPLGKGRAVATVLHRVRSGFVCLIDADIIESEHNIARRLREGIEDEPVDLLIGEYQEPERRRVVTPSVFRPLVAALFPEVAALDLGHPLSGFRVIRAGLDLSPLPGGYGVETHVLLAVAVGGGRVGRIPVGRFRGPLRDYRNIPTIAAEVAAAVLDMAERRERIPPGERPAWDAWVSPVVDLVERQPPVGDDDTDFLEELAVAAGRPLPREPQSR
jgi:glucosyl-3-phosphoglycerate synthase